MVRAGFAKREMRSAYRTKSGDVVETTKDPEKSLALLVSKNTYQRFVDYANEDERLAAERNREAAKLESIKKASYEISKNWDDTTKNIARRRRQELLEKRKEREEERRIFDEECREKRMAEHAKVLARAREILLYNRAPCRKMISALRASECYKERDAQIAFQSTLKEMDIRNEEEYARTMKEDVAKFEVEERLKNEKLREKQLKFGEELKKHIDEAEAFARKQIEKELEAGRRDQENMSKELMLIKECETEEAIKRKKQLQHLFRESMAEKQMYQEELKREEEFQSRVAEVYNKTHARIKRIHRDNDRKDQELRAYKAEHTGEKFRDLLKVRERYGDDIIEKAAKEKEAIEIEKREEEKNREKAMREERKKLREEAVTLREKQCQEEKELKDWELIRRFKKAEYNRNEMLEARKREWNKKKEYAKVLRNDIVQKEAERQREKDLEELATRVDVEKSNETMLAYGNKIIEESRGVRPLYPILKAMEEMKTELGVGIAKCDTCKKSKDDGEVQPDVINSAEEPCKEN